MQLQLTKKEEKQLRGNMDKYFDNQFKRLINKSKTPQDEGDEGIDWLKQFTLKKIIKEVVKKEARKEALNIMMICDEKYVNEFTDYFRKDNFNVICLVVDSAKRKLIEDGKMKLKKKDHFGHLLIL